MFKRQQVYEGWSQPEARLYVYLEKRKARVSLDKVLIITLKGKSS